MFNYDNICKKLKCKNITRWGMYGTASTMVNCKLINKSGVQFGIKEIPALCINKEILKKEQFWTKLNA